MIKVAVLTLMLITATNTALAQTISVGEKLPPIVIDHKGEMVIAYDIVDAAMSYREGSDIEFKPFDSDASKGTVRTIYHLAARSGIDAINQPYIDGLIAAQLPEKQPDSPYKTITILNTGDALWGTAGIALGQLKDSQKETAYAHYVVDENGKALEKWGLKKKGSAVIVVDRDNTVLYFKDGKMSASDIASAVAVIEEQLSM